MGIDVDRVIVTTFAVGAAACAGIAGVLYALAFGHVSYWFMGFAPGDHGVHGGRARRDREHRRGRPGRLILIGVRRGGGAGAPAGGGPRAVARSS
ncbi:MAG: hypothetical protein KatS3mg014_2387 [Actinomycetota bacterium]|nr:MAG: hypothetical protein KatS3mg014_2387 [Actinomycetota bacterium]